MHYLGAVAEILSPTKTYRPLQLQKQVLLPDCMGSLIELTPVHLVDIILSG